MSNSPYVSPQVPASSPIPSRLDRARHWLLVIAAWIGVIFLWDVLQAATADTSSELWPSLFRLVVGLGLTFAIWRGHSWARFALAGFCAVVLCVNLPALLLFLKMVEHRRFVDAGTVALIVLGYSAIAFIALHNSRVASLAAYRQELRDLEK